VVIIRVIAGTYVICLALAGYGLGQLFFGRFSLVDTICAVAAVATVVTATICRGRLPCRVTVAALGLVAIACVGIDAFDYYLHFDSPGNDNAWELKLPFILSLVLIGSSGFTTRALHRPNTSLERTRER
jgi:hypothetical protein